MTAKDVTVAPKILSGNSVPKEKGYGMYCIYLLEKLSCTPWLDDNGHDLVGLIIKNTNTLSAVRSGNDQGQRGKVLTGNLHCHPARLAGDSYRSFSIPDSL